MNPLGMAVVGFFIGVLGTWYALGKLKKGEITVEEATEVLSSKGFNVRLYKSPPVKKGFL